MKDNIHELKDLVVSLRKPATPTSSNSSSCPPTTSTAATTPWKRLSQLQSLVIVILLAAVIQKGKTEAPNENFSPPPPSPPKLVGFHPSMVDRSISASHYSTVSALSVVGWHDLMLYLITDCFRGLQFERLQHILVPQKLR